MTQRHLYPTIVNYATFNKQTGNVLVPHYPYQDRQFFTVGCGGKTDDVSASETTAVIFHPDGKIASRGHGRFLNKFVADKTIRNFSDLKAENQQLVPVYNEQWNSFRLFNLSLGIIDTDAEVYISKEGWKYFPFMRYCEERLETPIFYKKKTKTWFEIQLYDIRNKITGEYVTFDDMEEIAEKHQIMTAADFSPTDENLRDKLNMIVRYEDGLRYINK